MTIKYIPRRRSEFSNAHKSLLADIKEGKMSKKEIINKYKISMAELLLFSDRFCKAEDVNFDSIIPTVIIHESSPANVYNNKEIELDLVADKPEPVVVDEVVKEEKEKEDKLDTYSSKLATSSANNFNKKFSDDVICEILELYENGKTYREISEITGASHGVIGYYLKKFNMIEHRKQKKSKTANKATETVSKENTTQKKEKISLPVISEEKKSKTVIETTPVLEVGLIADRHDIPVSEYIFNRTIDERLMFNYKQLDNICKSFIENKIGFKEDSEGKKIPEKNLVVYVTGLTCALASIIKICAEYKVNLTLKHFNNNNEKYESQVIFDTFNVTKVDKLFSRFNKVIFSDCTFDEIEKQYFYVINLIEYTENTNKPNLTLYLFKDLENVWKEFGNIVIEIMKEKGVSKKSIFVEECIIKNDELFFSTTLSKTSNYDNV